MTPGMALPRYYRSFRGWVVPSIVAFQKVSVTFWALLPPQADKLLLGSWLISGLANSVLILAPSLCFFPLYPRDPPALVLRTYSVVRINWLTGSVASHIVTLVCGLEKGGGRK